MKKITKLSNVLLAAGMAAGLFACQPFEEDSWQYNSLIRLEWLDANPETGHRPAEVEKLQMHFYPHDEDKMTVVSDIQNSSQGFDVPTGTYDIMALQPSQFIKRDEQFKTATFALPTHLNSMLETVISVNPDSMYYTGKIMGEMIDSEIQNETYIPMERILKKLNFVVIIEETDELLRPAVVDLSGMAFRKKLWDMSIAELDEAVQIFSLTKHGRYLNDDICMTAFRGYVYCLGTVGRNILHLTVYDADNKKITLKYDVTPYLTEWSTFEETVHIRICLVGDEQSFYIEGWDLGDTSDFIFDYQKNGEIYE